MIVYEGRKMPCHFHKADTCVKLAEFRLENDFNIMHVCETHLKKVISRIVRSEWTVTPLVFAPEYDEIPATSLDNFSLAKMPWIVRRLSN